MGAARRGVARGTGKGTLTSAYENKEIWLAARMKPFFFPHAAGNGFRPEAKDRCIAASVPHGHNNGHPVPGSPRSGRGSVPPAGPHSFRDTC
jgi:hypothetical protein